jgi:hypothetical protein
VGKGEGGARGGYSQSVLLKRTAHVDGLKAGLERLERRSATHGVLLGPHHPKNTDFRWVLGPNMLRGPLALALSLALPNPLSPF